DTLWGIASRFLKDPWLWAKIWGLNREQVKNPHKIYPGDVIVLEKTSDGSRLRLASEIAVVKLSPQVRMEKSDAAAIPSIPATAIEPFLSRPLVTEKEGLANAPLVLGTSDNRVILNAGDIVYVSGLPKDKGSAWQFFRPGKTLTDPDDAQILGYEAVYLGDAKVEKFADIGAVSVIRSVEEILKGDRLVPTPATTFNNYAPHAPDKVIKGRIISVYGGVTEIGRGSIVTLSKGARDGLAAGNVLAVYRRSQTMSPEREVVQLPDERTGLIFVFQVFEKVAYALVMQSTQPIQVLDAVQTP
ncbi:MAG: LysM peptidoglycan-binding domain-containing protein, partial [Pseudomonadota bacterium]